MAKPRRWGPAPRIGDSADAARQRPARLGGRDRCAFTARLDAVPTIDIGLHTTTVGTTVYRNVEMADILREVAGRTVRPRASVDVRPTSLGPVVNAGADPITADAVYTRWAEFLRPDDIVMAETGTCSMGLAFAELPHALGCDDRFTAKVTTCEKLDAAMAVAERATPQLMSR